MDTAMLITAFVTLFVIIDPIGLMPLFVALTQGMSTTARRSIALRACVTSFGILALFAFFGEAVIGFIGISMPAFRIAGGVLLFLTALDMLFERRTKRREDRVEEDEHDDPSVFPLAIPLIAGPGSITTVILISNQMGGGATGAVLVLAVALSVLVVAMLMFLAAGPFERLLGKTGVNVTTRLLGMLLAALAVQFMLEGLSDFGLVG